MRSILIMVVWIALPFFLKSQIAVENYPHQIVCQVDATFDLMPPKATSSCSEVQTTFSEHTFSGGCLGTLVRTYLYTDECGNTASAEQYISLKDNLEPQLIGIPPDITVGEMNIPLPVEVSARDNSGFDTPVIFHEKREGGFIIRTWESTDRCGNTATGVQKITLVKS